MPDLITAAAVTQSMQGWGACGWLNWLSARACPTGPAITCKCVHDVAHDGPHRCAQCGEEWTR